ncbi:MAG TPA: hypothetical protein VGL46_13190 [Pseudonocardiaceae bacterium]|jgi:hypothetical protein
MMISVRTERRVKIFTATLSTVGGLVLAPAVTGVGIPAVVTALVIGLYYTFDAMELGRNAKHIGPVDRAGAALVARLVGRTGRHAGLRRVGHPAAHRLGQLRTVHAPRPLVGRHRPDTDRFMWWWQG